MEETATSDTTTVVTHKFLECIIGDIVAQESVVTLERLKSKTIVRFKLSAQVAESVTSRIVMQLDAAASYSSFKRLFEEHFGKELEDYDPAKDVPEPIHQQPITEAIMFVVFMGICALLVYAEWKTFLRK